jgi:hypothetical protein
VQVQAAFVQVRHYRPSPEASHHRLDRYFSDLLDLVGRFLGLLEFLGGFLRPKKSLSLSATIRVMMKKVQTENRNVPLCAIGSLKLAACGNGEVTTGICLPGTNR